MGAEGRYKPTPMIQIIAGTPQIKLLTAELMDSIVLNIDYPFLWLK